jgi:hypothetical protein
VPQQYDGLRSFLAECERLGEVTLIRNADWNLEIDPPRLPIVGKLREMLQKAASDAPAVHPRPQNMKVRSCMIALPAESIATRESRPAVNVKSPKPVR